MVDDSSPAGRSDVIPALFGLLTAKIEDAASHAVEGQDPSADQSALANDIGALLSEANILLEAIVALAPNGEERPD